jgi:hypothetical protein
MDIRSACIKLLLPIKISIFISLVCFSTQPLAHYKHHNSKHHRHWRSGNYTTVTVTTPCCECKKPAPRCRAWAPGYDVYYSVPNYGRGCSQRENNYDPPNESSYGDDINADYNMTY